MESTIAPTKKETQLLAFLRKMGWGEVKILIQNGEPVLLYETIKSVRLEDDETVTQEQVPSSDRGSTIELFK